MSGLDDNDARGAERMDDARPGAAAKVDNGTAMTKRRSGECPTRSNSDSDIAELKIPLASMKMKEVGGTRDDQAQNENEMVEERSSVVTPKTNAMMWTARLQIVSLSFTLFLAGWDSGAVGPLIPRLQIFYNADYAVVSLIFIMNAIGFLLGACMNVYLTDRFGFGKVIALGSIGQVIAYVLMTPALPFPVFCIAFLIDGWGISLQDGQSNSFVAGLSENASAKMGLVHALYGFGAVCAPFSATQFAQMPQHWSYHFIISLGLAIINTILLVYVFKGKTQDECLQEIGEGPTMRGTSEQNKYRQILGQKVVHLLAFFSLVYVGVEFTIGGWTVSYMQKYRGGGPSSGYVSTGFFGGLTVGRVALLWVNKKVGEHLIIYIYALIALGFELVVWLVPSLIVDAVAVSLAGVALGPMYPILMNETCRLIPQWLHTGSIAWIASFGFAGSALFPFMTGALAQKFGIVSLQPLVVVLMALLIGLWLLVPNGSRRQGSGNTSTDYEYKTVEEARPQTIVQ